jgi:hypothetical protein
MPQPNLSDQIGSVVMKLLRILVLTGTWGLFAFPSAILQSAAQSPSSPEALQAAGEFVSVISSGMISDFAAKMTEQVWPNIEAGLRAQNPKLDSMTMIELRNEFERLLAVNISEMMNDAPTIYARLFTPQEMRELIAFYRTPVGAKALKLMPQATTDLMSLMLPRMRAMQEKANFAFLTILQRRGFYAR